MTIPVATPELSGERIRARYRLTGDERACRERADDICIEQTVEFPPALIPDCKLKQEMLGRVESFSRDRSDAWIAEISFPLEIVGRTASGLLNTLFGNISIKPGILLESIDLPNAYLRMLRGPVYGIEGIRERTGVERRPLLCSALKPMGLSATQLANQAEEFALGGIDIIKDDHGLADQSFAPFSDRVARCAEAVLRANQKTGYRSIYAPNLPGPVDTVRSQCQLARNAGAGAYLFSPGLHGFDAIASIASSEGPSLPVIMHPTFLGSLVTSETSGIGHAPIFGTIPRLAGADASIFPNYGGRFSFSRQKCLEIAAGCKAPLGKLRPIFPTPGGGMTLERLPSLLEDFGSDVILLVGGGLHDPALGIREVSRKFRDRVEKGI